MKFNVKVNTIRTSFSTLYKVIGPKAECEAWLEKLKENFHPSGYGTYGKFITELPNGNQVMSAYRANSCD
jgi:hypothetical protein